MAETAFLKFDSDTQRLSCQGEWILANLVRLKKELKKMQWPSGGKVVFEGSAIHKMDSAGAWLILKWTKKLEAKGLAVQATAFTAQGQKLLDFVSAQMANYKDLPPLKPLSFLARIGKTVLTRFSELLAYLSFVGQLSFETLSLLRFPRRIRFSAIVSTIDKTGYRALGIIALLSFMIGVVIAYQMGFQLRTYGANVFIVDLLGLSILREFGPLLSAIMVAGRTGSSYTAQLGIMKINQELDALDTMGVTPGQLLLLPRIFGLFIALPLLTVWADIWGVIGGMIMANNMLGVSWYDFLQRFSREIPLRAFLLGLGKAPVFALLIASIGCFQGIRVDGNAESVGTQTTRSVVLGIFFIILADAFFSIIFSQLRL